MDLGLSGKKGMLCAASKGLGRAVAVALAREGVDLVINARSRDPLEAAAERIRAAFLCSTHAGYLTGQNIVLGGGGVPWIGMTIMLASLRSTAKIEL
jgi:shikimate 5-dehydrogenase